MITREEASRDQVILHVLEGFDPATARTLHDMLETEDLAKRVLVDFSYSRGCSDSTIALLAQTLASAPGRQVAVIGLGQHQRRLLRYFGIEDNFARPAGDRES